MTDFKTLKTIPIHSLLNFPQEQSDRYLEKWFRLPASVKSMLSSPRTGAFVRGLAVNYGIALDQAWLVANIVLMVCLGELETEQLPSTIQHEFKIDGIKAAKMAHEIERELLAPVMLDLNRYLSQKKSSQVEHPSTPSNSPSDRGRV